MSNEKSYREIERKFLVTGGFESEATDVDHIRQGYLSRDPMRVVRVRVQNERAFLTIKSKDGDDPVSRFEWEREISLAEGERLLKICLPGLIEKMRYTVPSANHLFVVDRFIVPEGFETVAEIELDHPDELFASPVWLGREVTGEEKYYNSNI